MFRSKSLVPALAGVGLALASPAAAVTPITFAQFFQATSGKPVTYSGGSGGATLTGTFQALASVLGFGFLGT
ncbi:hypothetical protein, partial [Thermaurantiacus sp.]